MKNQSELIDNPENISLLRRKIKQKKILRAIYIERYMTLLPKHLPDEIIVELGSGAGFIKEIDPLVITSDVVPGPQIDKVFFAEKMPFKNNSVFAFIMLDTFHHIKDPQKALVEMQRCLKVGGVIRMIEPYNTVWSKLIYQNFHHEKFDPKSGWKIAGQGRLSDSNQALPWIIFHRDHQKFRKLFPEFRITKSVPMDPFGYLLSGGLSKPQFIPKFALQFVRLLERRIPFVAQLMGMFEFIEIKKMK